MRTLFFAVVAAALIPSAGRGGEDYFLLIFGSQQTPNRPNHSHCFATFVKTHWEGDGPCLASNGVWLDASTISWLPESLEVRSLALLREPGHNFDLDTTLCHVLEDEQRVSLWGPYRIEPGLYDRAMEQIALLESGRVSYKALDIAQNPERVANCIHAVGSASPGFRRLVAITAWGETASFDLLRSFRRWIVDKNATEPWVASAIGLDQYPIIYRNWGNPHSNVLAGPVFRALGGEAQVHSSYGPPSACRK
jgi:hypothetical protein